MDEQGLVSPIAGGIRGIRRSVSSGIFTGRAVPPPPQPDPQTTQLLTQNSLTLSTVSSQLALINGSILTLSNSLNIIKDNLAVSDQLERQREAAKQRREAILAEQGLREGKESALEAKIQNALLFPVQRIASKAQGILSRFQSFLFAIAAGWLTDKVLQFFKLKAEGNQEALSQFKRKFLSDLLFAGSIVLLFKVGIGKIFAGLSFLAAKALRIRVGSILRNPFTAVANFIRLNIANFRKVLANGFSNLVKKAPNAVVNLIKQPFIAVGTALASVPIIGRFFKKGKPGTPPAGGKGLGPLGILNKAIVPIFAAFDFAGRLGEGQNVVQAGSGATASAGGYIASSIIGAKVGTLIGGPLGTVVGGIVGLGASFLLPETFAGIVDSITGANNVEKPTGDGETDGVQTQNNENDFSAVTASTSNDSELITPKANNNKEIAQTISEEGSDTPQFLNFPLSGNNSSGDPSGGPATSSKGADVSLPNIFSSDAQNKFVAYSESEFNMF